ncbi:hypothetical protein SAMN06297251_12647 [Fulvimarina manganoxydans]|uniref:Uncharacterized protein n=1 Tax=Fulvimarina manganoxydans TaxID=937218 RepID=A0A1W2EIU1_9HYPH|nr:hypothetical protein SAMN06297251_12647 [Fulvimarina manganoxydans]
MERFFSVQINGQGVDCGYRLIDEVFTCEKGLPTGFDLGSLSAETPESTIEAIALLELVCGCHRSGVPLTDRAGTGSERDPRAARDALIGKLREALVEGDHVDIDTADSLLRGAAGAGALALVPDLTKSRVSTFFARGALARVPAICEKLTEDAVSASQALSSRTAMSLFAFFRLRRVVRRLGELETALGEDFGYLGFRRIDMKPPRDPVRLARECDRIAERAVFIASALRGSGLPAARFRKQIEKRIAEDVIDKTVISQALPVWRRRADEAAASLNNG